MRLRETSLIAGREVREALRSRWFAAAAASFLLLALALSWLGLAGAQRSGLAGFDRTTAALLNLTLLFVPLVALSLGGLGVAGELEDGSLALLLSQPITRTEVYVGKYLGMVASMGASIVAGFGAAGLVVGVLSGGGQVRPFLELVGLSLLLAAATLSLGTLISVLTRSRARAVGAAFAAWLALVYLCDLGAIGLAVARNLSPGQVFALSLGNPVEQARVLGTLALTDRPEVLGPAGLFGADHFGPQGLALLLCGALLAWSLAPLLAGWSIFRKAVVS